jgi:PASTA domain-containing protein
MPDDGSYQGRLRELLRDPAWALSPRPDAHDRIRRSARRQRAMVTGLATCTGAAAAAAAVAVPLALSGGQVTHGIIQPAPAAARHASVRPSQRPHVTRIVMPNVLGLNLKYAETVILSVTTRGHIVIVHVKATQAAGVVVRQHPAPGTTVASDSKVTLGVPSAS